MIFDWREGAAIEIAMTPDVVSHGRQIESMGIKPKDALHLASVLRAGCDWFLTTDLGILKKVTQLEQLRVANPIDFVLAEETS